MILYKLLSVLECYFIDCEVSKLYTTFSNGSLGSPIDEERSEMR